MDKFSAVILAGGKGRRMKSDLSKVLFELLSKPLIDWVIDVLKNSGAKDFCTVVGHKREIVMEHLKDKCEFAIQEQQLGTGHAIMMARSFLQKNAGSTVAVMSGDVPLIKAGTLKSAFLQHKQSGAAVTILTAKFSDPNGYGRIVRDFCGMVEKIVEQKDATKEQQKICEINSGIYFFEVDDLLWSLDLLTDDNAQKEYYLTDTIIHIKNKGGKIGAFNISDPEEIKGINDRAQLYEASQIASNRIFDELTEKGVTIFDRSSTFISPSAVIEEDCTIYPCTFIKGDTTIKRGCVLGPNSVIDNMKLGERVIFNASQGHDSTIGNDVNIGPFSHIRPNCKIGDNCKIGAFVEVKNTSMDKGSKAPHFSYLGDAELGAGVNFACGSITVNYDGRKKHKTKVEDNAFIGCNVNLVAPVKVEKGAYIAAGSTITHNVPKESLAIARSRQENKKGWKLKEGDK